MILFIVLVIHILSMVIMLGSYIYSWRTLPMKLFFKICACIVQHCLEFILLYSAIMAPNYLGFCIMLVVNVL